jgi:S1-C subfamily serine protease
MEPLMPKFLFALLACFSLCCIPVHAPIKEVKASAVALVESTEFGPHILCSGTFVAPDLILTASHCIGGWEERHDETDEDVAITFVIPGDNPMDRSSEPYARHLTRLERRDEDHDLALLRVLGPDTFPHSFVKVADARPAVGDHIFAITSPHGLYFQLGEGIVSGYELDTEAESEKKGRFIAVSHMGFWFGSSGGGVVNSDGELIGVVSFTPGIPSIMELVDTDTIRSFVHPKSPVL